MNSIPDFNLGLLDQNKFSGPTTVNKSSSSEFPDVELNEWYRQNIGYGHEYNNCFIPPGNPLERTDDIRNLVRGLGQGDSNECDQWEDRFRPQRNVLIARKSPEPLMASLEKILDNLNSHNLTESIKNLKELMEGKATIPDFVDTKIVDWMKKVLLVMTKVGVEQHEEIIEILNCFEEIAVFEVTCIPLLTSVMTKCIKDFDGYKLKNCCIFLCKLYFAALKWGHKFSSSTFLDYILKECQNLLAYKSGDLESRYINRIECATFILQKISNKLNHNREMLKKLFGLVWQVQTSSNVSSLIRQKLLDLLLLWAGNWSAFYTSPYFEKNCYPVIDQNICNSNLIDKCTQTYTHPNVIDASVQTPYLAEKIIRKDEKYLNKSTVNHIVPVNQYKKPGKEVELNMDDLVKNCLQKNQEEKRRKRSKSGEKRHKVSSKLHDEVNNGYILEETFMYNSQEMNAESEVGNGLSSTPRRKLSLVFPEYSAPSSPVLFSVENRLYQELCKTSNLEQNNESSKTMLNGYITCSAKSKKKNILDNSKNERTNVNECRSNSSSPSRKLIQRALKELIIDQKSKDKNENSESRNVEKVPPVPGFFSASPRLDSIYGISRNKNDNLTRFVYPSRYFSTDSNIRTNSDISDDEPDLPKNTINENLTNSSSVTKNQTSSYLESTVIQEIILPKLPAVANGNLSLENSAKKHSNTSYDEHVKILDNFYNDIDNSENDIICENEESFSDAAEKYSIHDDSILSNQNILKSLRKLSSFAGKARKMEDFELFSEDFPPLTTADLTPKNKSSKVKLKPSSGSNSPFKKLTSLSCDFCDKNSDEAHECPSRRSPLFFTVD